MYACMYVCIYIYIYIYIYIGARVREGDTDRLTDRKGGGNEKRGADLCSRPFNG